MGHVGAHLHRIMCERGWTIHQVVAATRLNDRTIKAILAGRNKPHARTIHQLARGLGVEVDRLFAVPREMAPPRPHEDVHRKVAVILESSQAEVFTGIVEVLGRQVRV